MKITTVFRLGEVDYTMEINEPKEMDTLHKAIVLSNPPRYCNVCQNTEQFTFDTNKDKDGNTYVNVKCMNTKCFAKAKLGQYRVGTGYFWHKFEKWQPMPQTTQPVTTAKVQPTTQTEAIEEEYDIPTEDNSEDVPF